MADLLEDRVVLVTGASSGIGRESAKVMAGHGAKIVAAARREAKIAETVRQIKTAGGTATYVVTDVTDGGQVERAVQHAVSTYGALDAAFNNAGIIEPSSHLHEIAEEDFDEVIDVNLKGVFLCMKYEISYMLENGGGAIVNHSSFSGLRGGSGRFPSYTASKHAITGLTKSLSLDGRDIGITCGQIDIGNAETAPLAAAVNAGLPQAHGAVFTEPSMDPYDVARAVVFMSSLPLDANVQFMTVMATKMPYIGRG